MSEATSNMYKIILAPHVSEKATLIADAHRQFVFRVAKDATKPQIRRAIETLFKVEVKSVRVSHTKSKPRRTGQIEGRSKSWKKAYIALQEGFDIDFAVSAK